MHRTTHRIASAIFLLLLTATIASAQVDFNSFVNFGDSLTHNDLLGPINNKPQEMFGADPMEAVFNKAAASGDDLYRYAVGGSESGDVLDQILLYQFLVTIGVQEEATLFALEAGANDVLNHIDLLAANAPGENAAADAVINDIIANLKTGFLLLWGSHPGVRFIVWTIPDVTLTPRYINTLTEAEQENIRAHVFRVNRLIRKGDRKVRVVILDVELLLAEAIADPPVLRGQQLMPPPAYGEFDHLFGDQVHPTAVTNAIAANGTIVGVNEKWNDTIPSYSEDELADLAHIP